MSGWIKLHRSLKDHFLFDFNEPDKALAWIDLLMSASFEDSKIKIKGRVIEVKRGQFCASQVTLQQRWGMSQNKVKRFLLMLKNEGMIELETNELTSIITICNYTDYQDNERADERAGERADERSANEQTNDIKRIKELKEIKDMSEKSDELAPSASQAETKKQFEQKLLSNLFEGFWKKYPVKHGKQEAKKAWTSFMRGKSEIEIRKWSSLMLSYRAYRSEKNIVENNGFNPLQNKMAQGFINSRCWEDEPAWIEQFKQDWLEYQQSQQNGASNGTTD